jgi:hypothetical protein
VPGIGETIVFSPETATVEYNVTDVVCVQKNEVIGNVTAQVHLTRIQSAHE